MASKPFKINLVIIGSLGCGKTSLLTVFSRNEVPEFFKPPYFNVFLAEINVDGNDMKIILDDTQAGGDCDPYRALSYPYVHIILMCFSLDDPHSLEEISKKWVPEVNALCPNVPFILVGNKKDLRDDATFEDNLVQMEDGLAVAQKINACGYMECSARTKEGAREVLEAAARIGLQVKMNKKKQRCHIL